ncbi:DUF4352 domain-containing protein [Streptomyces sp. NBC_01257]|uniref:DUF4352 domain-containing protein n=1 Tax=Streptomyces sp. NBC_01257 TaxID=2903799 RepID=UPI002DDB2A0C|nr:DUF4352 domain-containing protein [Streptomyces sp. NBC_01257]WRZ63480.1 DUF4352 domain-containing protein [Streptomyces sp. NBC_01257]
MPHHQTQPGQPQQPGWGLQPPAPKKSNAGKIVGFGCLGIVLVVILFAIGGAVLFAGDADDPSSTRKPAATEPAPKPTKSADGKAGAPKEEKSADAPVIVSAKRATFKKSIIADNDNYTSVQVTIENNGDKDIDVNPLYLTITDVGGGKHTAELGVDEDQLGTVKLAPGENVTGTVTGKGTFVAKYVTYTEGLIGDSIRGNVS